MARMEKKMSTERTRAPAPKPMAPVPPVTWRFTDWAMI